MSVSARLTEDRTIARPSLISAEENTKVNDRSSRNYILRGPRSSFWAVFRIRIRIHMFLGLPDPDPLVGCMDPDPDPSIRQNSKKNLDSYSFVTSFELFILEK
jgi:hypothetical protein